SQCALNHLRGTAVLDLVEAAAVHGPAEQLRFVVLVDVFLKTLAARVPAVVMDAALVLERDLLLRPGPVEAPHPRRVKAELARGIGDVEGAELVHERSLDRITLALAAAALGP